MDAWTAGHSLLDWWSAIPLSGKDRKEFSASSSLIFWSVWKFRNSVVFDRAPVLLACFLSGLGVEAEVWIRAGLLSGLGFRSIPREWRDNGPWGM
ncbi:hypothetical protein BRADI_4g22632v3 [Brachypodium distachyon]|uniref:Reverse transcriptase zinc-binding domain-containing protein n=1 Tax=Brachypodium distachyon TaxID=15368 RepID=A0A0Q3ENC0_BRADI|nr:hypothetical protein BRADI_4g22632v3 [Brachypodium distachyon]